MNAEATITGGKQSIDFESLNLQVGSRLQLIAKKNGKETNYFTTLLGYMANEFLFVKTPAEDANLSALREGEVVSVRVFCGISVCSFVSTVDRLFLNQFSYLHLSFPDAIQGRTLRQHRRIGVRIPAKISESKSALSDDAASGTVLNLSVDGALIESHKELSDGTKALALSFEFLAQPGDFPVKIRTEAIVRSIFRKQEAASEQREVFQYGLQFKDLEQTQKIMLQSMVYESIVEGAQKNV